eukprot:9686357-Prorocentrum_lima.AAC.1
MTSSLVGSEMCIRDRAKEVQKGLAKEGIHIQVKAIAADLGIDRGRLNGCLLYTSDAADDM